MTAAGRATSGETGTAAPRRVLALSGSLRARSHNTDMLRAAQLLAPAGLEIVLYAGLGELPLFNPDRDDDPAPSQVSALRAAVGASDGLLIACPEYAHGVPGAFKNALDWLVGSSEFPNKPVALFNASPRASHAQAALREILTTMSARLVDEASIALPLLGRDPDAGAIATDETLAAPIRTALRAYRLALDGIAAAHADNAAVWG
ncbi:MAG TPA: NADPH-dependent FMN reductase [Dokdonella sp.]